MCYCIRMCVKIKKNVKILLLKYLNEDHILYFFLGAKIFEQTVHEHSITKRKVYFTISYIWLNTIGLWYLLTEKRSKNISQANIPRMKVLFAMNIAAIIVATWDWHINVSVRMQRNKLRAKKLGKKVPIWAECTK